MEQVRPAQIRNVAFFGHPKSGKTTLVEAVLHTAGLVSRAGRVEDGNTVSDYTPEEHERGYSVTTSVVTLDWDDHRLHLLDTPGFPDFEGEAVSAAAAVEAGVVLVDAVAGIEGGVEAACEHLDRAGVPARFFVVSRLDREHADFGRIVAALQARFGEHTVPIALPAADASGIGGVIDLVAVDPAHEDERAHDARDALIEAVAESDDALLERYLEGEASDTPTLRTALVAAVASGAVVPVLPLSATGGIGVRELVDALVAYAPPPAVAEDGPARVRGFR
ncbi:MAG: GTP-binding protein, partial [Dehalococcoidia bacterium]|nr:GTP-binding protein [Dehalococcoidia bacterium]